MERFPDKPHILVTYRSIILIPLYAFGHYSRIVEMGAEMVSQLRGIFSSRLATQVYFYLSLATLSLHFEDPLRPDLEENLKKVERYKEEIDYMRSACDANYGMWSLLVKALLSELKRDFQGALVAFEVGVELTPLSGNCSNLTTWNHRKRWIMLKFTTGQLKRPSLMNYKVKIFSLHDVVRQFNKKRKKKRLNANRFLCS